MLVEPWLPRAAAVAPDRVAIHAPAGAVSYAELLERACACAGALVEAGVEPGDEVGIALPAGLDFALALHACLLLGAAALPLDLRLDAAERARRAGRARLVLQAPLGAGQPLEPAPARESDAVAVVMHTSGTTAAPKRVELSYGNLLWSALGSALALGLDPAERWLCCQPVVHVGGLSILSRSAIYATTAVVHERFDARVVTAALMAGEATLVSFVATTLARTLDAGLRAPPALRCALIGGGPLPAPLALRAEQAGVPVAQTYGMTEACSQIATSTPGDAQTAGWPLPGTRMKIAPGGEILVAGPTVARGAVAPDGWLHTGDLGALDPRGRLTVTGRRAELIVTGGENVAAPQVEAALLAHPAVADAVVHGRLDPEWGEAVVATIVLRDGAAPDPGALRAHCATRLASFQVPKAFAFVEALPRTPSGKLIRRALGTEVDGGPAL